MGWILTFPSSILRPCCQNRERTTQGFRNSRRSEPRRKAASLRRRSPSAPVCLLSMKPARTWSTATSPAPQEHQTQSSSQTQCPVSPSVPSMINLHLHSLIRGAAPTATPAASHLKPTSPGSGLMKKRWLRCTSAPRFCLMT